MKAQHLFGTAMAALLAIGFATEARAQSSPLKTAADIPPGIAVPDQMDTRLGKLT